MFLIIIIIIIIISNYFASAYGKGQDTTNIPLLSSFQAVSKKSVKTVIAMAPGICNN
jgi:hypothetical protein